MLIEQDEKSLTYLLTTAEAVKMAKRAPSGTRFAFSLLRDARCIDKPSSVYRIGCSSYVSATRKDFLRVAGNFLSDVLEAKGARIELRITICEATSYRPEQRTYWL